MSDEDGDCAVVSEEDPGGDAACVPDTRLSARGLPEEDEGGPCAQQGPHQQSAHAHTAQCTCHDRPTLSVSPAHAQRGAPVTPSFFARGCAV